MFENDENKDGRQKHLETDFQSRLSQKLTSVEYMSLLETT